MKGEEVYSVDEGYQNAKVIKGNPMSGKVNVQRRADLNTTADKCQAGCSLIYFCLDRSTESLKDVLCLDERPLQAAVDCEGRPLLYPIICDHSFYLLFSSLNQLIV